MRLSLQIKFQMLSYQFHTKQYGNMMLKVFLNCFYIKFFAEFLLHRGYSLIINATRHDIFKIIQIRINVKCQAMHSYPAAATYAHSTYFTGTLIVGVKPNARIAGVATR